MRSISDRSRRRGGASSDDEAPADPVNVAREIALRRLTLRPHSRAELAAAMRRKNVPEEAIAEVLTRFSDVGLIDDAAFAEQWVTSRHTNKGLSKRALRAELRTKGVDDEQIEASVGAITTDDEIAAATELAAKRARSMRGVSREVAYRRIAGSLARRGYGPGVVTAALRAALSGVDDLPDEMSR